MRRGDEVQTPGGIGKLWSTQDELIVVEMEYRHRVIYHADQVEVLDNVGL